MPTTIKEPNTTPKTIPMIAPVEIPFFVEKKMTKKNFYHHNFYSKWKKEKPKESFDYCLFSE